MGAFVPLRKAMLACILAVVPPVKTIEVPVALQKVTSTPELSGLVWSSVLDRYLVVSDDTGIPDEDPHTPMVFALSRDGKLDPSPFPIEGIDALNDVEAICPGPDDTFFVATSHSPNRRGKTPPDRRLLLWLKLRNRTLVTIGRTDIRKAIEKRVDGRIDIEGLAWREGALYVGLKSPLGETRKAQVLRLDNALDALRGVKPRVSNWAEFDLCNQDACDGISDMLFLDDGSLLLAANAPKGAPTDGGGGIFLAKSPIGLTAAIKIHRFAGLRPEGLARAPGSGGLVVVFDTNRATPRWVELPWPH